MINQSPKNISGDGSFSSQLMIDEHAFKIDFSKKYTLNTQIDE